MVGIIVVNVLLISLAGLSCWQVVHAWRDPVYARNIFVPTRSSNPAVRRGHVRGLAPFAGCSVSTGIVTVASRLPRPGEAVVGIAGLAFFALCLGLYFSILCFNRPLFPVPPHMRDEMGTVTEWWRWHRDIRIALKEAAERDAPGRGSGPAA